MVRELIDEYPFEQLPGRIQQHHNGEVSVPDGGDELGFPASVKCDWPPTLLSELSLVASKCARKEARLRVTVAEVLPKLERLLVSSALPAAAADANANVRDTNLGTVYHDAADGE